MDEAHTSYQDAPNDASPWVDNTHYWGDVRRVYRGGGAFDERDLPRIARRGFMSSHGRRFNVGFRVARSVDIESDGLPDNIDRMIKAPRVHPDIPSIGPQAKPDSLDSTQKPQSDPTGPLPRSITSPDIR